MVLRLLDNVFVWEFLIQVIVLVQVCTWETFTINIKVWAAKVICQDLMYMNSLGDAFQFSIICSWDSFSFLGLLSFCKSFSRPRWRLGNKELSQLWKWADQNPVRFTVSAFVIPSKFWLGSEFSSNKLKIEGVTVDWFFQSLCN